MVKDPEYRRRLILDPNKGPSWCWLEPNNHKTASTREGLKEQKTSSKTTSPPTPQTCQTWGTDRASKPPGMTRSSHWSCFQHGTVEDAQSWSGVLFLQWNNEVSGCAGTSNGSWLCGDVSAGIPLEWGPSSVQWWLDLSKGWRRSSTSAWRRSSSRRTVMPFWTILRVPLI